MPCDVSLNLIRETDVRHIIYYTSGRLLEALSCGRSMTCLFWHCTAATILQLLLDPPGSLGGLRYSRMIFRHLLSIL